VGFGAVVCAVHWREPADPGAGAARNGILDLLALRIGAPSGVLGAAYFAGGPSIWRAALRTRSAPINPITKNTTAENIAQRVAEANACESASTTWGAASPKLPLVPCSRRPLMTPPALLRVAPAS